MKSLFTVVTLLIAFSPFTSQAQEHVGNGGGIHYCKNPTAGQRMYEAYDLAEYRGPWGVTIEQPGLRYNVWTYDGVTTKMQYLERALEKIASKNAVFARALEMALKSVQQISDKGALNLVNDNNIIFKDHGCEYVQMVNWVDDPAAMERAGLVAGVDHVYRDNELYQHLDPLSQAANDLHEAAYKVKRLFDELDQSAGSTYVRRFVANVFSTSPIDIEALSKVQQFGELVKLHSRIHPVALRTTGFEEPFQRDIYRIYLDANCEDDEIVQGEANLLNDTASSLTIPGKLLFNKKLHPGESQPLRFSGLFAYTMATLNTIALQRHIPIAPTNNENVWSKAPPYVETIFKSESGSPLLHYAGCGSNVNVRLPATPGVWTGYTVEIKGFPLFQKAAGQEQK